MEALTLEEIFVATLQPEGVRRMMHARVLPRRGKEVRALLPAWLACLAAMVPARSRRNRDPSVSASRAIVVGVRRSAAMIGHEYTNRTLARLLTLPVNRAGLLLLKLAVLAVMLDSLVVADTLVLAQSGSSR